MRTSSRRSHRSALLQLFRPSEGIRRHPYAGTIAFRNRLNNSKSSVPSIAGSACNAEMGVKETRRANLAALISRYPSAEAFSAAIGTDPTYIRNIRNGVRNLGDKLARQIEERLGLPSGGLDLPNFDGASNALPDSALISLLLATFPGLSREDADRVLLLAETLAKTRPKTVEPKPRTASTKPAAPPVKRGARRSG